MDSTAPMYFVWNLIEDSPKWAYTLPTFHSSCTLRTSRFCLEAEGVTFQPWLHVRVSYSLWSSPSRLTLTLQNHLAAVTIWFVHSDHAGWMTTTTETVTLVKRKRKKTARRGLKIKSVRTNEVWRVLPSESSVFTCQTQVGNGPGQFLGSYQINWLLPLT